MMADISRKGARKKKQIVVKDKEDKSWLNPTTILLSKNENDKEPKNKIADLTKLHGLQEVSSQPTIILKTRDGETRALSPNQTQQMYAFLKPKKESDSYNVAVKSKSVLSKSVTSSNGLLTVPLMTSSMCLIEEGHFTGDGILDYLTEHNEFLVIGCLGTQAVGKSTLMSKLCESFNRKEIFKIQSTENLLSATHCTSTFDLFVSENRIFFIDTPPLLSPSLMEKLIYQESKKSSFSSNQNQTFSGGSQITSGDFTCSENALEIMSLQTAAFLLSVCHVVVLVQDWFYDPNILRFLQTAEMLKPPMPTTSRNEELTEYFPHIVFLQNKARYSDFTQNTISTMQDAYGQSFLRSRLQIQSGIGIAGGTIINHLNSFSCGDPINLYILPDINLEERKDFVNGHPGFDYLVEKLKRDIFGISKNPLTHAPLSEKNWFHYSSKVWDAIKSSSFFHEYDRLLAKHE